MGKLFVLRMLLIAGLLLFALPAFPVRSAESGVASGVVVANSVRVKSAPISGKVVFSDGRTPVKDVPVEVWDRASRKFIAHTRTDSMGTYHLPALKRGKYFLVIDRRTVIEVEVVKDSDVTTLHAVIPRNAGQLRAGQLQAALEELSNPGNPGNPGDPEPPAGGAGGPTLLRTVLIVAGVGGVAVGIVALAGGFEDGKKKALPPASPAAP